jgi:SAM-dependent methyltransferase
VCPTCSEDLINFSSEELVCANRHTFPIIEGIADLLPYTRDENIIEEEEHWNAVVTRGGNVIQPHEYINLKTIEDYRKIYERSIAQNWPNYSDKTITIGEIGCSYGSAMTYLGNLEFSSVNYVGADVSIKRLQMGYSRKAPPRWKRRYVRATANSRIFKPNSLDIMFCVAALHHLDLHKVFDWVPSSIKHGGLFMLHEPSLYNPIAKVARKMVKGFHTPGEKPLIPKYVAETAERKGLRLVYTRGLHFLNGSLQYLLGKFEVSKPIVVCSYYLANCIDQLIISPSLAYSFVQIYKKI